MPRYPYEAVVSGIAVGIHEAGCSFEDCPWFVDKGVGDAKTTVLKAAIRHTRETGHSTWKHTIVLKHVDAE
jgi:hypothetical protein